MKKLCVLAPMGRMGQQVAALAQLQHNENPRLVLSSAVAESSDPAIGSIATQTNVTITSDLHAALEQADVYIDFSTPAGTAMAASVALQYKTAAVVGTTGLDTEASDALTALATVAPVFVAANFSPGVAVLLHLAQQAAAALDSDYDLEVVELHHRNKVDSPSGTALALGNALAKGRGLEFQSAQCTARQGQVGPRPRDEIGIFAVRGGDIVGEHTAFLIGSEERIEITHRAQKRSVFAAGALRAANWTVSKPPGRYSMTDLLAL